MTRSDSGSRPVRGVIVGHGSLPCALREAAASIVGSADALEVLSNRDYSADELRTRLSRVVEACGTDSVIVFVDMFGSSCSTAGAHVKRERPDTAVICGVNLPMLIRFLTYRDRLDFPALVRLMHETGQDAVKGVGV